MPSSPLLNEDDLALPISPTDKAPFIETGPPTRLCGIYTQDVLSFLSRTDVEEWRLVSRHSNSIVEATSEKRLPRHRLISFYTDIIRGRYTTEQIQPNGLVSASAFSAHYPDYTPWNISVDCLQWEFDPNRLKDATNQLVGQPVLVGGDWERAATDAISFHLEFRRGGRRMQTCLEMSDQLARESAIHLLHFLHHLGTGVYFHNLHTDMWKGPGLLQPDRSGTRLNPTIFEALQHARGGWKSSWLDIYAIHYIRFDGGRGPTAIFGNEEEAGTVRLHRKRTF